MYIYHRNIFENVNYAKKYLKLNNININDEKYIELKNLLKKNLGYLGIWTEWMFDNDININDMKRLYNYYKDPKFKDFTKDLDLNQYENIEQIYDHLTKQYQDRQVEQIVKALPSKTRSIVNNSLKELIFNNLEYYNELKDFYSKKGGRYKNIKDLIIDTKSFIENLSGPWNSEEVSKNLSKEEIAYIDNQTLIAWIETYERSCEVGSKSWCISTNKDYFKYYTKKFKKQYFIWDFKKDISSKKSLIGVTINANGNPVNIHFKDDSMGSIEDIKDYLKWLKPYSEVYIESKIDLNDWKEVIAVGIPKFVKKMIEKGFDPSVNDNFAIRFASQNGHTKVVKVLLDDPRVDPSADNNWAIRFASENGHIEVVKLLLERSIFNIGFRSAAMVDPSAKNNYAIRWASSNGHCEVVKLLLNNPKVNPSVDDNCAIRFASQFGHTKVVKVLLDDPRVDPSDDNNYAILMASENGHTKVVKLLLKDDRVDPSAKDNLSVQLASQEGYVDIVKLLLDDPRVDPSVDDNYAIRFAAKNGHTDVVKLLLDDDRVDPSAQNNWAILMASDRSHTDVMKILLDDPRVDPSVKNNYAIRIASIYQKNFVKVLLEDPRVRKKLTPEEIEKYENI